MLPGVTASRSWKSEMATSHDHGTGVPVRRDYVIEFRVQDWMMLLQGGRHSGQIQCPTDRLDLGHRTQASL
jgi:hypothetical protein